MPELPEVETIVRDLAKSLPHKKFSDVIVHDPFVLRQKKEDFIRRIKGQTVEKISRRGKAIAIELSSGEILVVQVMMTGQLILKGVVDKHTRITFVLSDGNKLLYNDQRRFGQLRVVADLSEINYFNILGPDPFSKDFTPAFMQEAFQRSSRPIKNILLDHTVVAGIGNIYACEILFRSRIDPKRQACQLKPAELKALHRNALDILQEAIIHRGSSMRNYRDAGGEKGKFNQRLKVYAREGMPCPRCGKPIKRIVQAGRSTFYCGHCQK